MNTSMIPTTNKKLKILLYHAGGTKSWLYPAVLHLKTYIDITYPDIAAQLEWLVPIQQTLTNDELLAYIDQHQPDALCTSHYIWNHEYLINQLVQKRSVITGSMPILKFGRLQILKLDNISHILRSTTMETSEGCLIVLNQFNQAI